MSWELFSKGSRKSRIFVYKEGGAPRFLTPLYVASFSSYGDTDFGPRALATLRSLRTALPNGQSMAVLLSAYDLKRRLGLEKDSAETGLVPELMRELVQGYVWHLDSGVYEKDCFQDSTWSSEDFVSVFRVTKPPCVVGYDYRPSDASPQGFEQALDETASLAGKALRGSQVTLLARFHAEAGLWEREENHDENTRIGKLLRTITTTFRSLEGQVEVLGVVENELGPGIRTRLRSIARLRAAFDGEGIEKPIHVFGASDPQTLALYSLAGADIFDGVNWSRYYLDTDDCCFRDKSLLSWKEPSLGEASSVASQWEMLGISNILRVQKFTTALHRLIETGQPQSTKEEAWLGFVRTCCAEITERS
jgi:hypothetical protein